MSDPNSVKGSFDVLGATLIAHSALLTFLIDHAMKADPEFESYARRKLDAYLGWQLKETGQSEELLGQARTIFGQLIDAAKEKTPYEVPKGASLPRNEKVTWRRRVFNWLERG
jgi:hypothetical protein